MGTNSENKIFKKRLRIDRFNLRKLSRSVKLTDLKNVIIRMGTSDLISFALSRGLRKRR